MCGHHRMHFDAFCQHSPDWVRAISVSMSMYLVCLAATGFLANCTVAMDCAFE